MKCSYKGPRNVCVIADEPDEEMTGYFRGKILEALQQEWCAFVEEVAVRLRNLEKGKRVTIYSKPISVTIEREEKEEVVK